VTTADVEDTAVVPVLGQRAYGGAPPSDRRSEARAQPVRRGHDGARPGRTPRSLGARLVGKARPGTAGGLGRGAARTPRSAGTRRVQRRGAAAPWPNCFAGHQFENDFL
jgi:hypothetical protein